MTVGCGIRPWDGYAKQSKGSPTRQKHEWGGIEKHGNKLLTTVELSG